MDGETGTEGKKGILFNSILPGIQEHMFNEIKINVVDQGQII